MPYTSGMKSPPVSVLAPLLVLAVGASLSIASAAERHHDHDHRHADPHHGKASADGGERLLSLDATYRVRPDGSVDVEQRFRLFVTGETIRRGPCLHFTTAFKGPGGLVLDNRMRIEEVRRDDREEPFHVERGDGRLSLFCGAADVRLEPGEHDYVVRYAADGDWARSGGDVLAAFDVRGPFRGLAIDRASATVTLPEGAGFERAFPTVSGGVGYEFERDDRELRVATTEPLGGYQHFLLDAAWPGDAVSDGGRWWQVMEQHPRLPFSALSAATLLAALALILARARRRAVPTPAAA